MASDSIYYLHLSDFHSGKDDYAQRKMFNKIIDQVKEKLENDLIPDLVFITGDIANGGLDNQYRLFNEEFLLELEIALGDSWEGKIFIVPGNHDVNRQIVKYLDRDAMCKTGIRAFDPTNEGKQERKVLIEANKGYRENITSHATSGWLSGEAGAFAEKVVIRGQKLCIVGINTAWLSKDKHDRHKLTAGVNLLEDALNSFSGDCAVKIVLGHHPLDWLQDSEIKPMRALLGNSHAIYLHGHLHKAWSLPEMNSAGQGYLSIQTGACFQARDDEEWRNGVLWGEIDIPNDQLSLQPCNWLPDHGAWAVNSEALHPDRKIEGKDWWAYPLPGSRAFDMPSAKTTSKKEKIEHSIPEGWEELTEEKIAQRRKDPNENTIIRFFDGSIPNWSIALHPAIPRRAIVSRLSGHLIDFGGDSPQVVALLGAGGEGKSTAFLQSVEKVAKSNMSLRILWRYSDSSELSVNEFLSLPLTGHPWLIASDDADQLFPGGGNKQSIFDIVKAMREAGRTDVRFLLACRDTDWRACGANTLSWAKYADFKTEELNGLSTIDADAISQAWCKYGKLGLGQLAGKSESNVARLLLEAAKQEAESEDGAFLGAMLKVRIGDTLEGHVLTLLQRLELQKIYESGPTLLDAFAYIAAMHAEKQMFLSQPVLAEVLSCQPQNLKRKVINPLGKEAAATGAGGYIYTRHRTIARCAKNQLTEIFGYDLDGLFVEMAGTAIDLRSRGHYIPNLHCWDYDLPEYFIECKRNNLAIGVSKIMHEKNPLDPLLLNNLAKTCRDAGEPKMSVDAFRDTFGTIPPHRYNYYEWGTAEGKTGNHPLGALLDALSLADQTEATPPNNKQTKFSLNGFCEACKELFEEFHDQTYIMARGAVSQMALHLNLDPRAQQDFERHHRDSRAEGFSDLEIDSAISTFQVAVKAAWVLCGGEAGELSSRLLFPDDISFHGLKTLIINAKSRSKNKN